MIRFSSGRTYGPASERVIGKDVRRSGGRADGGQAGALAAYRRSGRRPSGHRAVGQTVGRAGGRW
jgi:hypothetical protein